MLPKQHMFQLRDWSRLDIRLAWVREGDVGPQGHGQKNKREWSAAWLVLKGSAWAKGEGWETTAEQGQWLIPHPGPHEQGFSDDIQILSVRFYAAWPDGSYLWENGLGLVVDADTAPNLESSARKLLRLKRHHLPDSGAFHAALTPTHAQGFFQIQAALLEWMDGLHQALLAQGLEPHIPVQEDQRVYRALEQIRESLGRSDFDVDALAYDVGLSARQLDRILVETTGMTAHQMYQDLRGSLARERLQHSQIPVKEIAYELGFSSPSHFSSWFRRKTGMTPRRFRTTSSPKKS